MINVKAYADLAEYLNVTDVGEVVKYRNDDCTVPILEIVDFYNIPVEKISIILINGEHAEIDDMVKNEDQVVFFSPIDGG